MKKKLWIVIVIFTIANITLINNVYGQQNEKEKATQLNDRQFDEVVNKMHIIPGLWRPMFENEQVAWISPHWESQEYVWFDFPEAIQIDGEFIYLGHLSKRFRTAFPTEKWAPWVIGENGISYEQVLPNGVSFSGEITEKEENVAALTLNITNGSSKELKEVMLLTCIYLDGVKEFNDKTNDNKYVHTPCKGWVPLTKTEECPAVEEGVNVGWLKEGNNNSVSDLPVIVVKSKKEERLIATTWFDDTYTFIGNPIHPCVHADPIFKNLKPGDSQTITGELIFFEGTIDEFEVWFRDRLKNK
ncbi:MAG: hypothetical protein ABFS12_04865 [Bacteroidota bacterium]